MESGKLGTRFLLLAGIAVGGTFLVAGLPYYRTPLAERPFSSLHDLFGPSGLIGQGLGIVGAGMIGSGVVLYSLRKRVPALSRLGKLRTWLRVHIFLCLLGPFLVLLHTSFKFGGVVSISFWSMVLVVLSGVFGRGVYVWIPRTANGRAIGYEELRGRLRGIFQEVEGEVGISGSEILDLVRPRHVSDGRPPDPGDRLVTARGESDRRRRSRRHLSVPGAVSASIGHVLRRRREESRWRAALEGAGVSGEALERLVFALAEERRITQQLELLTPFQAAFRYWHAFHLPLATVMAIILIVHIGVAVAFGYTWIWAR